MRNASAAAFLFGLCLNAACYGDPGKFNTKMAEVTCELQDTCDEDGNSSCDPDDVEALLDAQEDICDYDAGAARKCIAAMNAAIRKRDCDMSEVRNDDECGFVYTKCN